MRHMRSCVLRPSYRLPSTQIFPFQSVYKQDGVILSTHIMFNGKTVSLDRSEPGRDLWRCKCQEQEPARLDIIEFSIDVPSVYL